MWPAACALFGKDPSEVAGNLRQYAMTVHEEVPPTVFKGEVHRAGAFDKQRRPFNAKNPFLGKVTKNKELFGEDAGRSCRHIEIDIKGSGLRYFAGDHVAIYPTNNDNLVERLAKRLGLDLDQVVSMKATDGVFRRATADRLPLPHHLLPAVPTLFHRPWSRYCALRDLTLRPPAFPFPPVVACATEYAKKQTPFPCPCSFRTALTHYVDITSITSEWCSPR